jgi:predicted DNA-binding transcriptional regulator AlpA
MRVRRRMLQTLPARLRTPSAAAYVGLAPATLERLRAVGGGPAFIKLGPRVVVYEVAALDAWVNERGQRRGGMVPTGTPSA